MKDEPVTDNGAAEGGPVFDDLDAANREIARLAQLAIRDPLTGLFNRRLMEEELARQIDRAAREGRPLSVAVLDLDDFRSYNQTHGHRAGDQALRQTATLVQGFRLGTDIACRYGGDEFVLMMPGATATDAVARLEPLRAAIAAMPIHHEGRLLDPVTISIGIADFPVHAATAAALFDAADAAVYRAKRNGHDRVESAGGMATPADSPNDT
ncbi:MAG: GGDEF domain-containing protein [Planctomycetia bacterium]